MMNKEEVIKFIIEEHKKGNSEAFCDFCSNGEEITCIDCPFHKDRYCTDAVIDGVIDYFIKIEESQKAETNLEHYILDKRVDVHIRNEDEVWHLIFKVGTDDACYESRNRFNAIKWLLAPYKKPTYKLTQFGYDLLKCCDVHCCIYEFWLLDEMYRKGYFKGIPTDVPIGDILENCEVVEE